MHCPSALYEFLPGAVNYCLGVKALQRKHYASAREMFKLAASWGDKRAQYLLGIMYFNGEHVAADRVLGLAWLALAAERPVPLYRATFSSALAKTPPAERKLAQAKLNEMTPIYRDSYAAERADTHYQRALETLNPFQTDSPTICLDGITSGDPMSCPTVTAARQVLDQEATRYFRGWGGHVTVQPLQQVTPKQNSPEDSSAGKP